MGCEGQGGGYQALLGGLWAPPHPWGPANPGRPGRCLGFLGIQPHGHAGVHLSCHLGQKGTVI